MILRITAACALLLATGASLRAEELFQNLSFDEALKQAAGQKKLVLVDFYTTWCPPCKKLDENTWPDPGVIALVSEKAIALKVDAEKEPALAQRYGVEAYPTIALIKADGERVGQIVGYVDPQKFTEIFNDLLSGKTPVDSAREKLKGKTGAEEVESRSDLANELARDGNYPEALTEYLWLFDDGMVNVPSYTGVRVSFLLSRIAQLGKKYPPARDALKTRRETARGKMESTPAGFAAAMDYAALNHYLDDDAATLAYFEKLPANDKRRPALSIFIFDQLIAAKRYKEALAARPYEQFKATFLNSAQPPQIRKALESRIPESGAPILEALAGTGQLDQAKELLQTILAIDSSDSTRQMLQEHLTRAGHPELLEPSVKSD